MTETFIEEDSSRLYFSKIPSDFFDDSIRKILLNSPKGYQLTVLYLSMLQRSIKTGGKLTINKMPMNSDFMATIFNMKKDFILKALTIFEQLGLVKYLEDDTVCMTEFEKFVLTRSSSSVRMARSRKRKKLEMQNENSDFEAQQCDTDVQQSDDIIDIDTEKEKEKDIETDTDTFIPPEFTEVQAYCFDNNLRINPYTWYNYYKNRDWMLGNGKMKSWKASLEKWNKNEPQVIYKKKTAFQNCPDNYIPTLAEKANIDRIMKSYI